MSRIAVVWRRDGAPVATTALEAMQTATAEWPADRVDTWTNGTVGMAIWRLATNPAERSPWPPIASNGAVLAADARLDRRGVLSTELGLTMTEAEALGDDALILAAWERWGPACVTRLEGAFAFVIWDPARRQLFCARDRVGARPLSYHAATSLVVVASDRAALLAVPGVPARVDEVRVASFLAPGLSDRTRTFYADVSRLPGGHHLTVTATHAIPEAYWHLDPARALVLPSDAEYAEGFRARFDDSLRACLRGPRPIVAALSGGLDSSSVVVSAAGLMRDELANLYTISARFPSLPACDEGEYIDAVVAPTGVARHDVLADRLDPLGDLERGTGPDDDSFQGLSYYMHGALYDEARRVGGAVMIEGTGGDVVVSHGSGRLQDLAGRGRLGALWREARRMGRYGGASAALIARQALRAGGPTWLRALWERLGRGYVAGPWMVSPDFARRVALSDRRHSAERMAPSAQGLDPARFAHWQALQSPQFAIVLEAQAAMAATRGVDVRDPFLDARLLEYCLALPVEQKVRNGRTRIVLRHALEDRLPAAILRRRKTRLNLTLASALAAYGTERFERLERASIDRLAPYVTAATVRHVYREARRRPSEATRGRLWRLATLSLWLARAR